MISALVLAGALAAVPASTGVGIQAYPVCLDLPAQPGHAYSLGTVYVTNTGNGTEPVSFRVGQLPLDHGAAVTPSWVSFAYPHLLWVMDQDHVQLIPGGSAYISATLTIPSGARPGRYASEIIATAGGSSDNGGITAALGAAAAVPLRFSISAPAPSCAMPALPPPPPGTRFVPAASSGKSPADFMQANTVLMVLGAAAFTVIILLTVRRPRR